MTPAKKRLINATKAKSTRQLLDAHKTLRQMPDQEQTPATRLAAATIASVLEDRHNLTSALDAVYADEYTGTYHDAILTAMRGVTT